MAKHKETNESFDIIDSSKNQEEDEVSLRKQIEEAKETWKLQTDKKVKQAAFDKLQSLWNLLRSKQSDFKCGPKKKV